MEWSILLLPLLGGYRFVTKWNYTKYSVRRHSGYWIFFDSAIAAFFLGALALLIVRLLVLIPGLEEVWKRLVPFRYSGTATLAFLLGFFGWMLPNRFPAPGERMARSLPFTDWHPPNFRPTEKEATRKAIADDSDYLEGLLEEAIVENKMVLLTMMGGKVYAGRVAGTFLPGEARSYLKLVPYLSGYRTADTQEVKVTIRYYLLYKKLNEPGSEALRHLAKSDFGVVVPTAEVESIRFFDEEAYAYFQQSKGESSTGGSSTGGSSTGGSSP